MSTMRDPPPTLQTTAEDCLRKPCSDYSSIITDAESLLENRHGMYTNLLFYHVEQNVDKKYC